MTKYAALQSFFEGFGIPAYEQSTTPDRNDIAYPYLTYEVGSDAFDGEVALSFSLWYRSTSWLSANAKAEQISAAIGRGGIIVNCDGGALWIKRETPFAQHMTDEDDSIRRIICTITIEFFTED